MFKEKQAKYTHTAERVEPQHKQRGQQLYRR